MAALVIIKFETEWIRIKQLKLPVRGGFLKFLDEILYDQTRIISYNINYSFHF